MYSTITDLGTKFSTAVLHTGIKPIIIGSSGLIGTILASSAMIAGKRIILHTQANESSCWNTTKKVSGYALLVLGFLGGIASAGLNGAVYGLSTSAINPIAGIVIGAAAAVGTLALISYLFISSIIEIRNSSPKVNLNNNPAPVGAAPAPGDEDEDQDPVGAVPAPIGAAAPVLGDEDEDQDPVGAVPAPIGAAAPVLGDEDEDQDPIGAVPAPIGAAPVPSDDEDEDLAPIGAAAASVDGNQEDPHTPPNEEV